jgi:hypothetical protein
MIRDAYNALDRLIPDYVDRLDESPKWVAGRLRKKAETL